MYKDSTYKEKLAILKEWTPHLIDVVKKDLKNEHLKQDFVFVKKYLQGKNINKLTLEDLILGYSAAIEQEESGEKIAEFITNRWMIHSSELYGFFEKELSKVNPDFDAIEELEEPVGRRLIDESVRQFGALNTYLFSVINSVAFNKGQFQELKAASQKEQETQKREAEKVAEARTFDQMKQEFEQRLIRIEDKYEKKLDGLQRKYLKDTDTLKKQVANLQRKLNG